MIDVAMGVDQVLDRLVRKEPLGFRDHREAAQPVEGAEDPNKVGTLLLSKLAPAGLSLGAEYDPYSLLRSTQDLFGLSPLANAGAESTLSFASQLTGGGD